MGAGHMAPMGDGRDAYRVLVERSEGKSPFGRPRHRWEDNIKIGFQEVRFWEEGDGGMEWIDLRRTGTVGGLL